MGPRHAVTVLGLVAGAAQAASAVAQGAGPVLRLVWVDPSDLAAGSALAARAEAKSLLARMGVEVSWRRAAPGEMRRTDEVWVVLLGEGPPAPGPPVLGATRTGRALVPVVWVRVPNVRAAVGVSRSGGLPRIDQLRVGVALGRVVVHEAVHVLVPSLAHGRGLMSRSLDRHRLTGPSIPVETEAALALQAALRGDPIVTPAATGVLASVEQEKDR